MSIISKFNITDAKPTIMLNTQTSFDMTTGAYMPGVNGQTVLNGGLAGTNAVVGRQQLFKSTYLFSLVMRAACRYPDAEVIIRDTEFAQKKERLLNLADIEDVYSEKPLGDRVVLTDSTQFTTEAFYALLREIYAERLEHPKDYLIESPFLDRDGKSMLIHKPLIVVYDSWSKDRPDAVGEVLIKYGPTSSETNILAMSEGNIKTKIMSQMPMMAARAGICLCFSAHVGDKFEMSQYQQTPKVLPTMRQGDKLKGVGSDFSFLISNCSQIFSAGLLVDKDKEVMYPSANVSDVDLYELTAAMTRGKNNASGLKETLVMSQARGYMSELTYYNALRKDKYFGLVGNNTTHAPALYPDAKLMRTTATAKLKADYKLRRAIELIYQLWHVQNNWTLTSLPVPFDITPLALSEALEKSSFAVSDILESRGYWTYGKQADARPYLSLFDILAIISGKYYPKYLSAKTVS